MNLFKNHIMWQRYNKLLFSARKMNKNKTFLTRSAQNSSTGQNFSPVREIFFPNWGNEKRHL